MKAIPFILIGLTILLFGSCGDSEEISDQGPIPESQLEMGARKNAEDSSALVIHALHTLHARSKGKSKSSYAGKGSFKFSGRRSPENIRLGLTAMTYSNYDLVIFGRTWRTLFSAGLYQDAREVFEEMERACLRDTSTAYTNLMIDYADAVTWYGVSWTLDPHFYEASFISSSELLWRCEQIMNELNEQEIPIDSSFIAELTYNTAVTELIRTSGRAGFAQEVAHGHVNVKDVARLAEYIDVRQAIDTTGNLNGLFDSFQTVLKDHDMNLAVLESSNVGITQRTEDPARDSLIVENDSLSAEINYQVKFNTDCLQSLLDTIAQMQEVVILLDHSGSMMSEAVVRINDKRIQLGSRYTLVQDHALAIIGNLGTEVNPGLISVGSELHQWPEIYYEHGDSESIMQTDTKRHMMEEIENLSCFGATPLVRQIERAIPMFSDEDNKKMLVILSDGADSYNYNFQLNQISERLSRADIFPFIISYLDDTKENKVNYSCFNELIAHGGAVLKMVGDCSDLSNPIDSWIPVFVPAPGIVKYDCGEHNPSGYVLSFPGFENGSATP